MKKLHVACEVVFVVAILNFFLFFIGSILLGGDALNGKEEAGHYYLSNHGVLTEVNVIVFMYSTLHAASIFITHPLAMVAGWVYLFTGGWSRGRRPWTYASLMKEMPGENPLRNAWNSLEAVFWRVADRIEGIFWILLDSWRKPDLEFVAGLPLEDCISQLHQSVLDRPSRDDPDRAIIGYFTGCHFILRYWKFNFFFRNAAYLVLAGKFSAALRGTRVRAWHRFATGGLLFFMVWFGFFAAALLLVFGIGWLREAFPSMTSDWAVLIFFSAVAPVLLVIFLTSILVGSAIGGYRNAELTELVQSVLGKEVDNQNPAGGYRDLFKLDQ